MRHAVLAATLAFGSGIRVTRGPVPPATRKVAGVVMAWLDRRRSRIDAR